jgi:hypothetical protein
VNNKTHGKSRCIELFNTVCSNLNVLQTLLGAKSKEFTETSDRVAESMFQCQVAYANETKDWEGSLRILAVVLKVAKGEECRKKIEQNIEIARNNLKLGRCWFCRERPSVDSAMMSQQLHKSIYWKDVKSGKYPDLERQVQDQFARAKAANPFARVPDLDLVLAGKVLANHTAAINVPRCEECKTAHNEGDVLASLTALVIAVVTITLAIAFWDGWSAAIAGTIGVIGAVAIGTLISTKWYPQKHGSRETTFWTEFPPVKELLADGWQVGDAPSNT